MECVYDLMTFGIPADVLPVSPSGEMRLEGHHDYCRRLRKVAEGGFDNLHRIVVPGTYDVLLGRGRPLQKHSGNLRYHHIIESYQGRYEKASKLEKTKLSKLIVQTMKNEGGRFLKQDDMGWIEIDDEVARYKVSHTFRNHRIAARVLEKRKNGKGADNRRRYEDESDVSAVSGNTPLQVESDVEMDVHKRRRLSDTSSTLSAQV